MLGTGSPTLGHRPFQGVVSSEHPLVVVSTTQVEDWDDSSSFLMERLLWALSLASTDLISVDKSEHPAVLKLCSRPWTRSHCSPFCAAEGQGSK